MRRFPYGRIALAAIFHVTEIEKPKESGRSSIGMRRAPAGGMTNDQRDPQTYAIIGAAIEVHGQLGCGFLERVYQFALASELTARGIPHRRECRYTISYKGQRLPCLYVVDFVCYDAVVVEVKAVPQVGAVEEAQVINYLKVSGFKRALWLNFGARSLQYRRFIWDRGPSPSTESASSA